MAAPVRDGRSVAQSELLQKQLRGVTDPAVSSKEIEHDEAFVLGGAPTLAVHGAREFRIRKSIGRDDSCITRFRTLTPFSCERS